MTAPTKGVRIKGHALSVEWSGEYGAESSSTGYCKCGWSESASNQPEVRFEYRTHLQRIKEQVAREEAQMTTQPHGRMTEYEVTITSTQDQWVYVLYSSAEDEAVTIAKSSAYADGWNGMGSIDVRAM